MSPYHMFIICKRFLSKETEIPSFIIFVFFKVWTLLTKGQLNNPEKDSV